MAPRKYPPPRKYRADHQNVKVNGEWVRCKRFHAMEGDNIVYYPKKLPDGTVKRYRTCRACRNESQRKSGAKRRRAAANARKLAAIEAAKHCDHCRNEPRAVDLAYISSLARTIVELGGKVPEGPDEVTRMDYDSADGADASSSG